VNAKAKGDIAEEKGCHYLREQGCAIIDRNVYNRFGEIDIIALKEGVLHFIEVKSARSYEQAVNNMSRAKLQKLHRTIQLYLQQKRLTFSYCLDVLIVVDETIEWIENITL
jgi:putative endonuclease